MHTRQPMGAHQARRGHALVQNVSSFGVRLISSLCLPRQYPHGRLSHSHKPSPRVGQRTRETRACHRAPEKGNEDTARKLSEIISNCLLWEGALYRKPVLRSLSDVHGLLSATSSPPSTRWLHLCRLSHTQGEEAHSSVGKNAWMHF